MACTELLTDISVSHGLLSTTEYVTALFWLLLRCNKGCLKFQHFWQYLLIWSCYKTKSLCLNNILTFFNLSNENLSKQSNKSEESQCLPAAFFQLYQRRKQYSPNIFKQASQKCWAGKKKFPGIISWKMSDSVWGFFFENFVNKYIVTCTFTTD